MNNNRQYYVVGGFALISLIVLIVWLSYDPTKDFVANENGTDNRGVVLIEEAPVVIGEKFTKYSDAVVEMSGTWPRFRGVNYDNVVSEPQDLIGDDWGSNGGPQVKWSVPLGEGHAGAAIYKGRVYVLDYDEANREDALRCFSLLDGTELWRRSYGVKIKRNHGMSRTIPAITEKYVVTIGPRGHVMCVDRINGDLIWGIDMGARYNITVPQWYTAQCPLIDGEKVILAPSGSALMIGVDINTGEVLWECPNEMQFNMSHSSILPYTILGKKMYVYSADGGICGVSADGATEGTLLWQSNIWNHSVVAPSPFAFPDGRIFLTAGYGAGSEMIQVSLDGDKYKVELLKEFSPKEGLACEQQTPVLWRDHLFGIIPKDGGANRIQLVCVDPADVQKMVWTSGTVRFGLGPYIIVKDNLYVLSDDGTLTLVKLDTTRYIELASKKIIEGSDSWGPMAIADGLLVMRDSKNLVCVDI